MEDALAYEDIIKLFWFEIEWMFAGDLRRRNSLLQFADMLVDFA